MFSQIIWKKSFLLVKNPYIYIIYTFSTCPFTNSCLKIWETIINQYDCLCFNVCIYVSPFSIDTSLRHIHHKSSLTPTAPCDQCVIPWSDWSIFLLLLLLYKVHLISHFISKKNLTRCSQCLIFFSRLQQNIHT